MHAPGTLFEDRYGGDDPWEDFLTAVDGARPAIEVLGVTDYWRLESYVEARRYWEAGRMPGVQMIFPNVELRLATATKHGAAINVHLLISPEDPDHIEQAQRLLNELTFVAHGETYRCNGSDLVRLGRQSDPNLRDQRAALEHGGRQFKVSHEEVRAVVSNSAWARKNVLIGFASSSKDGTGGLQSDSSFKELRREIERMSRIVFSSFPNERRFWLGEGSDSIEILERDHGGRKVCLHGSDAHESTKVGAPDHDRRTWLKGDPTFETLRQACIAPDLRAVVAPEPPTAALANRTVAGLELRRAPWWPNARLPLNPGLVAIVGPRGSGKTALADFVAIGGHADAVTDVPFVRRAARFLRDIELTIDWGDGTVVTRRPLEPEPLPFPRVQYLSQQFVERLCAADSGVTEALREEIERVVFEAHPPEKRAGATTFAELRDIQTRELRARCGQRTAAVRAAGDQIIAERRKQEAVPDLEASLAQQRVALGDAERSRAHFVVGDAKAKADRLRTVRNAITARQTILDAIDARRRAVDALQAAANDLRAGGLPKLATDLQITYRDADLSPADWQAFGVAFVGDVDAVLAAARTAADGHTNAARGASVAPQAGEPTHADAYIKDDANLAQVPLAALELEAERLQAAIGLDEHRNRQLRQLDEHITKLQRAIGALEPRLTDAKGAAGRVAGLFAQRLDEYAAIFESFVEEAELLTALYRPLHQRLAGEQGAMDSLAFVVRRRVDVGRWVAAGEELLDLRRSGPFAGRGTLRKAADELLVSAWEHGSAKEVRAAMEAFRAEYVDRLREHATVSRQEDAEGYWAWSTAVSYWLMSTDHVTVEYGIEYDGVSIERLSPGTRGIVLVLLYVSIDRSDDRPLIIDQPEENLDPKSIFDELVGRFSEVRHRRQVIIVTHNANLVVNTDADQVIVADAQPRAVGELPSFRYMSGGLENPDVRDAVCSILEGGEAAFRERARRLRIVVPT